MMLDVAMIVMLIAGFGLMWLFVNWNEKQINK